MNTILQIIGSIASIASVPLAIYLYLRQREAKFRRLRQDIAKTLSYKIGEDSTISLFEISSVIEAKARDFGVNPNLIQPDGIVEDLVSDTISNPMLDSDRKRRVVENLQQLHTAGLCLGIISAYSGPLSSSLSKVTADIGLTLEEREQLRLKEAEDLKRRAAKPTPAFQILSTTFGVTAAFVSILSFFIGTTALKNMISLFQDKPQILGLILGALSSLIAGLITGIITGKRAKAKRKALEERKKMEQEDCQQGASADS